MVSTTPTSSSEVGRFWKRSFQKNLGSQLKVYDIMTHCPVVVREIETVERLIRILSSTRHNGFPVIFNPSVLKGHSKLGTFSGLVQRSYLCILLAEKAFRRQPPTLRLKTIRAKPQTDEAQEGKENGNQPTPNPNTPSHDINMRVQAVSVEGYGQMDESDRLGVTKTQPQGNKQRRRRTRGALTLTEKEIQEDLNKISAEHTEEYVDMEDNYKDKEATSRRTSLAEFGDRLSDSLYGSQGRNSKLVKERSRDDEVFQPLVRDGTDMGSYLDYEASAPIVSQAKFDSYFPNFPSVDELEFNEDEKKYYVDLRPYMNPTPYTIHAQATADRAYALFRGLGLRHLSVINDCHDCIGIITRHNLLEHHLEEMLEEKQSQNE
eukprot:gb/GECG01013088.1/.p1 GENE.gb/GECG01013088.1/~~gb/GECG01013088.1/.p1  ORF type:complete len:377 (+),score=45.01 gb/GECG01013088.1/:1-1131(+)